MGRYGNHSAGGESLQSFAAAVKQFPPPPLVARGLRPKDGSLRLCQWSGGPEREMLKGGELSLSGDLKQALKADAVFSILHLLCYFDSY
jgi:hypothetical protein